LRTKKEEEVRNTNVRRKTKRPERELGKVVTGRKTYFWGNTTRHEGGNHNNRCCKKLERTLKQQMAVRRNVS